MSNQSMLDNILPPGTLWGDLVVTIPPFDMSCWDDVESIQAWEDLTTLDIDPPEELDVDPNDDTYEPLNYAFWEELPAAEPLEEASPAEENDQIVPIPIVETVADISTASHREENP